MLPDIGRLVARHGVHCESKHRKMASSRWWWQQQPGDRVVHEREGLEHGRGSPPRLGCRKQYIGHKPRPSSRISPRRWSSSLEGRSTPPSSVDELLRRLTDPPAGLKSSLLPDLLRLGGFPEPFLSARLCDYAGDVLGEDLQLRYFRDVLGHEVDFVLLRRGKPWTAIEAKSGSGHSVGGGFKYLIERTRFVLALRVGLGIKEHVKAPPIGETPVHLLPADQFLAALL